MTQEFNDVLRSYDRSQRIIREIQESYDDFAEALMRDVASQLAASKPPLDVEADEYGARSGDWYLWYEPGKKLEAAGVSVQVWLAAVWGGEPASVRVALVLEEELEGKHWPTLHERLDTARALVRDQLGVDTTDGGEVPEDVADNDEGYVPASWATVSLERPHLVRELASIGRDWCKIADTVAGAFVDAQQAAKTRASEEARKAKAARQGLAD